MTFHCKNLFLAALLLPASAQHSFAGVAVPEGFEELAKGQHLWVEVSLYGDTLGLFEAEVNLEKVTFLKPESLLERIKTQFNDDPALLETIHKALAAPLARNGQRACSSNGDAAGCGYLETDTAAIIYDENNAQISLFLDKKVLQKPRTDRTYYQATQESERAFIHQQNLNFVADKDYQSFSIQGNGALAVTDGGYLNLDWNGTTQRSRHQQQNDLTVNNAWFRQDLLRKFYLQLGEMDTRDLFSNAGGNITLSQLPIGKIRGLRAGSTRAYRNPTQDSKGTPIAVFLSRDARIDARRGNQLLASFYLNAGAQTLDTRSFPDGSYTVSLAVYEENKLVRTEDVPYTRTGIAAFDSVEWFFQIGKTANDGSHQEHSAVTQLGVRFPLLTTLALTSGATLMNTRRFLETAIDWSHGFSSGLIDGVLSSRFSYLYGTNGERGNIQQLNYNDGFSLSFYRNALSAEDCNSRQQGFYAASGCYRTVSLMLSVPLGDWYTNLGYTDSSNQGRYVYRRELPDTDSRYNEGLPWQQIYTRSRSKAWQAGLSRSFNIKGVNLNSSLSLFMRDDRDYARKDKGGYLSFSLSLSHNRQGDTSRYTSLGATWQHQQGEKDQLSYNLAHNWYTDDRGENEYGLNASGINSDSVNGAAYIRRGGQFGNGSLTVSDNWSKRNSKHTLSSSGNYSSTLALSRSGLWFGRWGDGRPASAIAVAVKSPEEQKDASVAVSLDSGSSADISASGRGLFAVPGYQQTTLTVNESLDISHGASSEVTRGSGTRTVFLPPGKLFKREVQTVSSYTWYGQLMDEQQAPLTGGMPLNVTGWDDQGNGGFSAQSSQLLKNLYLLRQGQFYQCRLQVKDMRDVIRYVGSVTCQNMAFSALPEPVQRQAQLMLAGSVPQVDATAMKPAGSSANEMSN